MKKGFIPILILGLIAALSTAGIYLYVNFQNVRNAKYASDQQFIPQPNEAQTKNLAGLNSHISPTLGVSFDLPKYLTLDEKGQKISIYNLEKEENKYIGISISVENVNSEMSLEEYLTTKYPNNNYGLPSYQSMLKTGTVKQIDEQDAFISPDGTQFENKEKVAWIKKGDTLYVIKAAGNGETGTYYSESASQAFDTITLTWKFTD